MRRYTFKLYPNAGQSKALKEQAELCAQLWNAALEQREIQWAHECQRRPKGERRGLTAFTQGLEIKTLRSEDPRFAAMSACTPPRVLGNLDLAFKAFFQRAKSGAGASSGYPQYKSVKHADSIPFRDHPKGWRMHPAGKNWKLYLKGVPGFVKARGAFPAALIDIKTMDLLFRDGAWWASIAVQLEARMTSGVLPLKVAFDLIDEFARVEIRANGGCPAGCDDVPVASEEQIRPEYQGVGAGGGVVPSISRSDDKVVLQQHRRHPGVVPSISRSDDKHDAQEGSVTSTSGSDDNYVGFDALQSEGDRRFKKFSWRWRDAKRRLARRKATEARRRKHQLHLWTTDLVRKANDLLVVSPPIKEVTRSAKGTERNPGAAVATVAAVNRHVLGQAPAMAVQMLAYKAAEAGIPIQIIQPETTKTTIGHEVSNTTKAVRKVRAKLKKLEA